MRSFLTSLLALIISFLTGALIVEALAIATDGMEEWMVALGLVILVTVGVALVFLAVQLAAGSGRAANIAALILAIVFAGVAGLVVWANIALTPDPVSGPEDDALIAGIVLPGFAIILVQWLIVRWLGPRTAPAPTLPRFGRGGQTT
jgi:hypothetical protein